MEYRAPNFPDLGAIGNVINPMFVDNALAFGPTRVMAAPDAGYATLPHYGLAGWREAMDVFTAASFLFPE